MATATVSRTLHVTVATPKNDTQRRMSITGFRIFWVEVFGNTIANGIYNKTGDVTSYRR